MTRLEEIRNHMLGRGLSEKEFEDNCNNPLYVAMMICYYAHRKQKRVNGEDYAHHPRRMIDRYYELLNTEGEEFDARKVEQVGLPLQGVGEVTLLHDVVEDTEFTINDCESVFDDCQYHKYFVKYIKEPLTYITHNKKMPYPQYIEIVNKNPISALVKMLDLEDNMRLFSLDFLDENNYRRTRRYVTYAKTINDKWHFIEALQKYRQN